MNEYPKLDMNTLKDKQSVFITNEEALKDIVPIQWADDVINGKKIVIIE